MVKMVKIVIVTPRKDDFGAFVQALEKDTTEILLQWVRSGADALFVATKTKPELMIIDENLGDMDGVTLVRKLLHANAMINTALVSRLSPSEFHEATEGLGILGHLPVVPTEPEARTIIARLTEVIGPNH